MTWPRPPGSARARRTVAYTALVVYASVGIWRVEGANRELHDLVQAEEAEEEAEQARMCRDQWDRVPQLRDAIALSVREGSTAGAGAVFDVAGQLADDPLPPETSQLLEAAVDERVRNVVEDVVAQYPDPSCDLADALEVLARTP